MEDEVANLARGQIPESSVYHVGNWVSFTHKILGKRRVLLGFVFERIIPNVELREVPMRPLASGSGHRRKARVVGEGGTQMDFS